MTERSPGWVTKVTSALGTWGAHAIGAPALLALAALSVGCGRYEDAAYPQPYEYVPPRPATAEELAAQQQAARAESREIVVGADASEADEYPDTDPSALTEFKPALDGHGAWVDDSTYGTVWVPSSAEVGADFQPYVTAGHWTYADDTDYVWVSDYSWGWAPFHYGRWVHLPGHGWSWIPGRRYAGAWVTWRTGPTGYGYVGWAPLGPSWYWSNGVAVGWSFGFYRPYDYYVYCPHNYVYHPTVGSQVVRGPAAQAHHGRTQDYVPASPTVAGGGRVVATPSVGGGDRVVATPSVGGDRIAATPAVGGGGEGRRVAASPVRGPRPEELGLKSDTVVAPPRSDQGLARAQIFAAPKTAVAAGAAAPAHFRPANVEAAAPGPRGPATSAYVPARPQDGTARASIAPGSQPTYRAPSSFASSAPGYASPGAPSYTAPAPAYRPPPPTVAATPSPTYRAPSSAFSPSPRYASPSPAYRPPPPSVMSTPSPRFSAPAPTYRSAPPTVSSPRASAPAFRPASPSVGSFRSAPPTVSSPRASSPSFSGGGGSRAAGSSPARSAPSLRRR